VGPVRPTPAPNRSIPHRPLYGPPPITGLDAIAEQAWLRALPDRIDRDTWLTENVWLTENIAATPSY
jgi:hypothetical protein